VKGRLEWEAQAVAGGGKGGLFRVLQQGGLLRFNCADSWTEPTLPASSRQCRPCVNSAACWTSSWTRLALQLAQLAQLAQPVHPIPLPMVH